MLPNPSNTYIKHHNEILWDVYPMDNLITILQLSGDLLIKQRKRERAGIDREMLEITVVYFLL